jgi:hypothetical protein
MKKINKRQSAMETTKDEPAMTVGLYPGDRHSHYCLSNAEREAIGEGRIQSTEAAFRRHSAANLVCALRWNAAPTLRGSAGCRKNSATR